MFKKYTKQSKIFPIIYKDGKKVFIFGLVSKVDGTFRKILLKKLKRLIIKISSFY